MDFEKYLDKAIEIGSKAVEQHGQQAWDIVLFITRINAVQELVIGFVCLAIVINYLMWLKSSIVKFTTGKETVADFIRCTLQGMVSFVCLIAVIATLLNTWTWVALFKPELYIAMQALDAVIK